MSGRVIQLAAARLRLRPPVSRQHPALIWVAGGDPSLAHRRVGEAAACGAPGSLTLALPTVPRCPRCYRSPA
jgi:hypothetical protein